MFENSQFLTPVTLWKQFNIDEPLLPSKLSEIRYDKTVYSEYFFSGRSTATGRVRIYGLYVSQEDNKKRNAILYIPGISEKMSYEYINEYAKLGYSVLAVDVYGKRTGGSENHTVYPDDVSYANYETRGRRMDFADDNAKKTCWYEWVSVCKYALKFLKSLNVDKIGIVGLKTGADIAWQLAATEDGISLAVMLFGAGWYAYRGIPKYSDKDLVMDDERRRFVAAVDAHAYAQYVKCPVLYLTSTNNLDFDFDRANDTLARINPEVERYFNYAPALDNYLDEYCKKDEEIFLAKYFGKSKKGLAKAPTVTAEQDGGYISVEVNFAEPEKVVECKVYISEGSLVSAHRNWSSCAVKDDTDAVNGKIKFEYVVSGNFEQVFLFASVKYKDGSGLSSKLIRKKTSGIPQKRANLIYSSINGLDGVTFYDKNSEDNGVFVKTDDCLYLVKGADGIYGAYSPYGLISYKLGEACAKADENSIIKFDLYANEYCKLKLILALINDKTVEEYTLVKEIEAGEVWKNFTVSLGEFKSEEGRTIRDFKKIFALMIESESKYAVNNILLI